MKNSASADVISHNGVVQDLGINSVFVSIVSETACTGCHSQAQCTLSGKQDKTIEVFGNYTVAKGDNVIVQMQKAMGFTAILYGYLLPLFSVIIMLITLSSAGVKELASGLFSLAILLPYYIILFIFRKKISKKFTFTLKV